MNLASLVIVMSGYVVAAASVSGQDRALHPEAGRSRLTNFTPIDYGAAAQNWAFAEDSRGVLYAGNGSGVLEYDGVSWRQISLSNRTLVRSLARDADDRIWVGGKYDLGYLAPDHLGRTQFVSLRGEVPEPYSDFADVWSTHTVGEMVFFRTSGAVFQWDGSTMRAWPAETSFSFSFVVQDTLYLRQPGFGLMRFEDSATGEGFRIVSGGERFSETSVNLMLPFDANRILVGTSKAFLLWDGEDMEAFETEADGLLADDENYGVGVTLPDGSFGVRIAPSRGFVVIDRSGRLVEQVNDQAGLQDNTILSLYADGRGDVWLGLANGITRVEIGSPFTRYDAQAGLPAQVSEIARHDGELFAGVGLIGVKRLDLLERSFRTVESQLKQITSFLPVAGDLLATGVTDGVYRLAGERFEAVRRSVSNDYRATRLHRWSGDPDIVAVTLTTGLSILRRSGEGWADEGGVPGVDLDVWSIAEASDGQLWLGTHSSRVARVRLPDPGEGGQRDLDEATVTVFGPEDGLPEGTLNTLRVGDEVYVAGLGETVFRYDEATGRFLQSSTFDGARSGHPLGVFQMREDMEGRVWIASTYGPPVAGNPRSDGTFDFDVLHRFRQSRIVDVYPDVDGVVWLMGTNELIRYDERSASKIERSVPPLIRRVSLGEDSILYGGAGVRVAPELAHGSEELRFTYAASGGLGQPRFRTQLEGFDADWSIWSTDVERSYTNLPLGDYRFRVEGEGGRDADYVFTVLPPWYRTWWAYSLYAVWLGSLGFGAHTVQRRRLIKKERASAEEERLKLQRALLESEKKRMEDELNVGHRIQMGMLTTDFSKLGDIDVAATVKPAREVGGDLYDVFFVDEQHLCCYVGDVSGKGVPAALFMAISKTLIKAIARHQRIRGAGGNGDRLDEFGWSTGAIMSTVNDELSSDNHESMFVTAFLCIINIDTGKGMYTNAGHNPPYILHAPDDPRPLTERHGPVLGAVEGIEYGEALVDLNRGEQLLIFTDGVTEAFNEGGELFTDARLERLISGLRSTTAADTVHAVLAEVENFEGDTEQTDDITILAVRRE
jgi:serine phosphatase RsbU (regulator of sigma subunit)